MYLNYSSYVNKEFPHVIACRCGMYIHLTEDEQSEDEAVCLNCKFKHKIHKENKNELFDV